MSQIDVLDTVKRIKKTHENVMVTVGVLSGTVLLVYFFTFARLIDTSTSVLIWIQVVSTILLVLVLIFIKRVGFFLTKLLIGRKQELRSVFNAINSDDLAMDEQTLLTKLRKL